MKHLLTLLTLLTAAIFTDLQAQTAPDEAARGIMEKYKTALVVVTVKGKVVTKTNGKALPENEQQRRTLGITVAENGLVAISNSAIDATVGLTGQRVEIDGEEVEIISANSEYETVEISYGDSSVLSGKVVRQDASADIAFVLPDNPDGKKFDIVDLSNAAADALPAQSIVGLSRSSAPYGYMPTINLGHITGVFKSNRTFFLTSAGVSQGMPIFSLDGKVVGLTVIRINPDGRPSGVLGTIAAGSIQVMANLANESL